MITELIEKFESSIDVDAWLEFNERHGLSIGTATVIMYCSSVYIARRYMAKNKPFNLRLPLAAWSAFLAFYSIISTVRLYFHMNVNSDRSFMSMLCKSDHIAQSKRTQFWMIMFLLSKYIELVDTAFIVARNQKLIFLHWYHHALTLWYISFALDPTIDGYIYFMTILNNFIHSVMYTYYALKALRVHIPPVVNIIITLSQILQMIFGLGMLVSLFVWRSIGNKCDSSIVNDILAFLMYLSYLILFTNFFIKAYIKKNK